MTDSDETLVGEGATGTPDEKLKGIAQQTLYDVKAGNVNADVADVIQQRVTESGLDVSPEQIDDVANDIEKDASR